MYVSANIEFEVVISYYYPVEENIISSILSTGAASPLNYQSHYIWQQHSTLIELMKGSLRLEAQEGNSKPQSALPPSSGLVKEHRLCSCGTRR